MTFVVGEILLQLFQWLNLYDILTLSVIFQGVFISKIADGGTAERDGRLQVGDKVLSVRTRKMITDSKLHVGTNRSTLHIRDTDTTETVTKSPTADSLRAIRSQLK